MTQSPVIGFIGAGNLAHSLVSGLVANGFQSSLIWCSDRNLEKREAFHQEFKVQITESPSKVVEQVDVLVLAIKPKDVRALLQDIQKPLMQQKPLILSVVAGVHTQQIEKWLGSPFAIVRAMPNTPALLGAGATGLYANTRVSDTDRDRAESLLRTVGITTWVNHEHDLDIVTILSGSGPAYFLLLIDILQKQGEHLGLPSKIANLLTLQTALGASRMALETSLSIEELTSNIATSGGITEKALQSLEQGGIRDLIKKALEDAKNQLDAISHHLEKE